MGELAIVTLASFMFMAALPAVACPEGATSSSGNCCGNNSDGTRCCTNCDAGCTCDVNGTQGSTYTVTSVTCDC